MGRGLPHSVLDPSLLFNLTVFYPEFHFNEDCNSLMDSLVHKVLSDGNFCLSQFPLSRENNLGVGRAKSQLCTGAGCKRQPHPH